MHKKNIFIVCSIVISVVLTGGCSGKDDPRAKQADRAEAPAEKLSAIAFNASGDISLLSLDLKSKKVASKDIERGASLFIDVAKSGAIGIATGSNFKLVNKKNLKEVSLFQVTKKIEFAAVCGGQIFLIDGSNKVTSLKAGATKAEPGVQIGQIDISTEKITDAACFGADRYLAIAMSGTAKKILVINVRTGKIFDRHDLKLSQGKLGQGPLIAGDRIGNFTYMVFNEYGNYRRNYIFRYDMIDHKEDKMLSLGTDSRILFRPYYISDKDLLLVAADIATRDAQILTGSADSLIEDEGSSDEEKKNHVVLIDTEDLELRRIIELPGGYFSTKAVAIKDELVYFAVDEQIFRLDLKTGQLINFADLPAEVIAYLFI